MVKQKGQVVRAVKGPTDVSGHETELRLRVVGISSHAPGRFDAGVGPCAAPLRGKVATLKTGVRTRIRFPLTPHDNPSQAIPTVRGSSETRMAAPDIRIYAFGEACGWRAWRDSNPRPTA
jgi:hypothetical protein